MLRSKWLWIVAVVVVLAGVYGWMRYQKARELALVSYDTTPAARGRIEAKVTATGTLSAIVTVQVGSQVSGTVAALHADFNSQVKKGQLVAKIDPSLFEATRQQARANLVAAQGNLAKVKAQAVDAKRQASRTQELLARKLVAQADYDTAQATADADDAAVDAAAGTVEQARAQLHQAEVNLAYTDIRSPTDGTVISRNVDVGQTVAASLQAPVIFMIAQDLQKMQVDTSVAEADIGKIKTGTRATFSVDAYPAERFTGSVRQVRNAPQTVQNVVTYDAVIDVDNGELKLKPGMTANCTFIYAEKEDALRVPNAALRFVPPPELLASLHLATPGDATGRRRGGTGASGTSGAAANGDGAGPRGPRPGGAPGAGAGPGQGDSGRRWPQAGARSDRKPIWLLRDGKPVRVIVKVGISDGSQTEVVEGEVKEGDLAITDVTMGATTKAPASNAGQNFPRRML